MKFKTSIEPTYEVGTTKSEIKFAWMPHRIKDILVWLERYEVLYVYVRKDYPAIIDGNAGQFTTNEWVKVSERRI